MQFRIEDLYLAVGVNVTSGYSAFPTCLDVNRLRSIAVQLRNDALYVEHDFGYVFLYTRNGRELMLHTIDLDAACSRARQARQQNAAKRVSEGGSVSALQRLYDELLLQGFRSLYGAFQFRSFK